MTDNSNFLPNQHAVTSDALFNLKPSSVNGRSFRCSIPPTNGSIFTPQTPIVLYVPARRNSFLDPTQTYLRLTVKNNEAAAVTITLDPCASCFINSISVYSGSNLLEQTQAYNVLFAAMLDLNMSPSIRGSTSAMYGTADTSSIVADFRKGCTIAGQNSMTFTIPIISSVIGLLAEKYLPLNLADDIRIEINLEENLKAVCYTGAATTNWTILNAELDITIVELQKDGMDIVNQTTPPDQPIYLHATNYKHFPAPLAASAGQASILVPIRSASVKSLWVCPRRATEINSSTAFSLSSRANPNFASYNWRIAGLMIPQKPVTLINAGNTFGYAEAYVETMKAMHSLNNASYGASIGVSYYQVADTADTTVGGGANVNTVTAVQANAASYKNGFIIAQELETFANRSDTIISGMNTLGSQVFFECNIITAPGATYTLNFFALIDVIFVIENGLITVRY